MNLRDTRGSAPVETVFAMVVLLILVLGVIETTFFLYGRNVVASSAHEGARAAIELDRDPSEAQAIAGSIVRKSSGSLLSSVRVITAIEKRPDVHIARVIVTGILRPPGPLPIAVPIRSTATVSRSVTP